MGRGKTSSAATKGELALTNRFCGVLKSFPDVVPFKIGIVSQDLLHAHPFGHHPDDGCDGNAKAANARRTTHLVRLDSDPVKAHANKNTPAW